MRADPGPSSPLRRPTREEVVQIVGDLDDAVVAAILATGAAVSEVEEAAWRATGKAVSRAEAQPLSAPAEAVYDILVTTPTFATEPDER